MSITVTSQKAWVSLMSCMVQASAGKEVIVLRGVKVYTSKGHK